jgi:hypothetical protein
MVTATICAVDMLAEAGLTVIPGATGTIGEVTVTDAVATAPV